MLGMVIGGPPQTNIYVRILHMHIDMCNVDSLTCTSLDLSTQTICTDPLTMVIEANITPVPNNYHT